MAASWAGSTADEWAKSKRRRPHVDERAVLAGMVAEGAAEHGVQDMGGGVGTCDGVAARAVDEGFGLLAAADLAFTDADGVDVEALQAELGVQHFQECAGGGTDDAGVADLAAGLGVERAAVEDEFDGAALVGAGYDAALGDEAEDGGLGVEAVVAHEVGAAVAGGQFAVDVLSAEGLGGLGLSMRPWRASAVRRAGW